MNQTGTNKKQDSFFLATGKFGLKGAKYFVLTILLFGGVNLITFITAIYKFVGLEKTTNEIILFIAVFIVGSIMSVLSCYLTYKYLLVDGIHFIYKQLEPLVRKVCSVVMNKVGTKATEKDNETKMDKVFNTQDLIEDVYGNKVPRPVKWGIAFVLDKIPFVSLLTDMKDARKNDTPEVAAEYFYQSVNTYIVSTIFKTNTMKWIYWLLPLDFVIQVVLIYFMIR